MKITVIIMILNLILIFDKNHNNINGDLSLYTNRPFALKRSSDIIFMKMKVI